MRKLLLLLIAFPACKDDPTREFGPDVPIVTDAKLLRAESCAALEESVENGLIRNFSRIIEQQRKWARRAMQTSPSFGSADMGSAPASADGGSNNTTGPSDYTVTNTQVAGVDEPDFMKNDGTRILVLRNSTLFTAKSWPPESLALLGRIEIEGQGAQMFLAGDRVVVLSSVALPNGNCNAYWCSSAATKVSVIDVSDLAHPKAIHALYLPGRQVGSRRVGSSVRLVLSEQISLPSDIKTYPDYEPQRYNDLPRTLARLDALEVEGIAAIRARSLRDWIPFGARRTAAGELIDLQYRCEDFYTSNAPVDVGLTTVATIDLLQPELPPARVSAVVAGWQIYATANSLYLAAPHWWWNTENNRSWTYLHKFDLSDAAHPRYAASGGIAGTLLNQFALDELDGYLRAATTERSWSADNSAWSPPIIEARVRVLQEREQKLEVIGQTDPLENGESITAVRFMGTRALVVTFLRTDPLYTIDSSDPHAPRIAGELKVPGFSTYLHPVDDKHVMGIGVHVPDPSQGPVDWRDRSMKLSLYDVSDFDNPREVQTLLIGTFRGYSPAAWDHHAFNYFASRRLLAIPFIDEQEDPDGLNYWLGFRSEIKLFRYQPGVGFAALGAMTFSDMYRDNSDYYWSYWYGPYARRSVMASADDGTEYLYGITDAGIRAAKVDTVGTPLSTARFSLATP